MEVKESNSDRNEMSGYIPGLSSSIQDSIGEIRDVIGSLNFGSELSAGYAESMMKTETEDEITEGE